MIIFLLTFFYLESEIHTNNPYVYENHLFACIFGLFVQNMFVDMLKVFQNWWKLVSRIPAIVCGGVGGGLYLVAE